MAVFKYKDPNTQKWEIVNSTVTGDTLPIGAIIPYSSDNIPDNWLLADGRAVSRTTYKNLFDVIGVTYGSGDGNTTFNLPNLKGKIPVGQDEDSLEFAPLAMEGGEKTHTLTIEEMPSHKHKVQSGNVINTTSGGYGVANNFNESGGQMETKTTGGSQPHNNLQPYLVTNYIIKAAQSSGLVATVVDNLESNSETNALSAKQGKILNEKFSKNIITANIVGTTTTAGINKDLTLVEQCKVGNKLYVENGAIKIGKDVSKVLVYAKALFDDTQVTNSFFYIKHNEIIINRGDVYGIYNTISFPAILINVQEGDSLSLLINTGTNASVYDGTYITVEVVE